MRTTGTLWDSYSATPTQMDSNVVDLHITHPAGEVIAQVSFIEPTNPAYSKAGFLIRVWPANGTHEYGGANITDYSMVLTVRDDGHLEVRSLDFFQREV